MTWQQPKSDVSHCAPSWAAEEDLGQDTTQHLSKVLCRDVSATRQLSLGWVTAGALHWCHQAGFSKGL